MRIPILAGLALAATASPALAYDYGVFSGRGWSESAVLVPNRWTCGPVADPSGEITFGTPANPAPLCGPALLFRVHRAPIYNAPPAASDLYRAVPLR